MRRAIFYVMIVSYGITVQLLAIWLASRGVPFAMGLFSVFLAGGMVLIDEIYRFRYGGKPTWMGRRLTGVQWFVSAILVTTYLCLAGVTAKSLIGDNGFELPVSDAMLLAALAIVTLLLVGYIRFDLRST